MNNAPDFTLHDQDGDTHTLASYKTKWLVLYFYPKDDTPGCTKEACAFRDGRDQLRARGAEVVGVSRDSVASHKAFAGKYDLNFTLLSDPGGQIAKAYNATNGLGSTQRKTFLINPAGQIAKVYPNVTPSEHASEVLKDLAALLGNTAQVADSVKIGGETVSRIGLGTNRVTDVPEAHALLNEAVSLGVNFIDTAHRYQNGASETAIGNTLAPYAPGLVVATKGGLQANGPAGSPKQLRSDLEDSLSRLKIDQIQLYQLHRVDPAVPFEDSLHALKAFQSEGKIRYIGLSEVTLDQLKHAREFVQVVSVQNKYNVVEREHEPLVDYCTAEGIVFIPWFPLGGRADSRRLQDLLSSLAEKYEASPQQVALAWLLKRSPMMLPIPGTLSIEHLQSNLKSADIKLADDDYELLSHQAAQ